MDEILVLIEAVSEGFPTYFYHMWTWRPYWSCDLCSLNIFLFPQPQEVYEAASPIVCPLAFTCLNSAYKYETLSYNIYIYKRHMDIKRDDSKIEQNYPLYGDHGIQIMKLKWLTLEFVKFSVSLMLTQRYKD